MPANLFIQPNGNNTIINPVAGYVAINHSSPTYPLHVAGRAFASSWAVSSSISDLVNNSPWYGIGISNLLIGTATGTQYAVQLAGYFGVLLRTSGVNFAFTQASLGLNTTTPTAGFMLDSRGSMRVEVADPRIDLVGTYRTFLTQVVDGANAAASYWRLYDNTAGTTSPRLKVDASGKFSVTKSDGSDVFTVEQSGNLTAGSSGSGMVLDFRSYGANRLDLRWSSTGTFYLNPDLGTDGGNIIAFENSTGVLRLASMNATSLATLKNSSELQFVGKYWTTSLQVAIASMQLKMDATTPTYRLAFSVGVTDAVNIRQDGYVGIGTTAPYTKTEINYGTLIAVSGTTPNTTTALTLSANDPGTTAAGNGTLLQIRPITNRGAVVAIGAVNTTTNKDANGALVFYCNSGNGQVTEAMRLINTGSFGIGTTAPLAKLDVSAASGTVDIRLTNGGTTYANIYAGSGVGALNIFATNASEGITFGTNNTAQFYLSSTGNLGVGATASIPAYAIDARKGSADCNIVATSSSTTTLASLAAFNDSGTSSQIRLFAYGDSSAGTAAGVTLAGRTRIFASSLNGLLIHNSSSGPIQFAQFTAEVARLAGNVLAVGSTVTTDASRFLARGNSASDEVIARVDNVNATLSSIGARAILEVAALNSDSTVTRGRIQAKGASTGLFDYKAVEVGTPDNVPVYLFNNNTTRVYIDSTVSFAAPISVNSGNNVTLVNGNLVMGTAGNGIDFSATAGTGTSELLDDYEEGNWSPTITSSSGTVVTNTSASIGRYTKVGRLVTIQFYVSVTSVTTPTGNVYINNLPFTVSAAGYGQYGVSTFVEFYRGATSGTNFAHVVGTLFNNSTTITCYWYSTDRTWNTNAATFLSGSANIMTGVVSYITDA